MIARIEPTERQLVSPLGRTSPLLKLGVALAWLVGLALTLDPRPPIALTLIALVGGLVLGRVPVGRLARGVAPLWLAALGIGVFNAAFSGSNADPSLPVAVALGPLHVTWPAVEAGAALAARVFAIAAVGVVFAQTTDSTRLVDSLAGQLHVPERFAYGALAAYQAIPRLAAQLTTLRQARRMRGLRGWHPRILVAILVLAIRHGDRLALAMDARAFGAGPRTRYRELRWTALDGAVGLGSLTILVAALVVGTLP